MSKPKILLVDDDRAVCHSLSLFLKRKGFEVDWAHNPTEALSQFSTFAPDLVVLDMNFSIDSSGREGIALLSQLKEIQNQCPIILITAWASVQLAVEGMKLGASDFLAKPWENKHLLQSITTLLDLQNSRRIPENSKYFEGIIGQNKGFLEVLEMAKRIAPTQASVLISGPSGSGKELIAEAIHYQSQRSYQPFVKVNLGGLSTGLFDSELFGHVKGAFTGASQRRKGRLEAAEGGSVFLDEIGELDVHMQVKLLRVLQEKRFEVLGSSTSVPMDVRIISATNRDLEEEVSRGTFREDLLYRINLIHLRLPSLNERKDDIPLLVEHFSKGMKDLYGIQGIQIKKNALDWLQDQSFKGNIRELKNVLERTLLMCDDPTQVDVEDFKRHFKPSANTTIHLPEVGLVSLEEMDNIMVSRALTFHQNHITKAAQSLGITRTALYRRMQKYGIPLPSQSKEE